MAVLVGLREGLCPVSQGLLRVVLIVLCCCCCSAPEVLDDRSHDYDEACDRWSLGVVLYAMAFGKLPWRAESRPLLHKEITSVPLELPPLPERSEALKGLICRMLAVDPAQRPTLDQAFTQASVLLNVRERPDDSTTGPAPPAASISAPARADNVPVSTSKALTLSPARASRLPPPVPVPVPPLSLWRSRSFDAADVSSAGAQSPVETPADDNEPMQEVSATPRALNKAVIRVGRPGYGPRAALRERRAGPPQPSSLVSETRAAATPRSLNRAIVPVHRKQDMLRWRPLLKDAITSRVVVSSLVNLLVQLLVFASLVSVGM